MPTFGAESWWRSDEPVLALVGPEGAGKTWAAIDAISHLAASDDVAAPIIIHAELARQTQDALDALLRICTALGERSGLRVRDARRFWRLKLNRWCATAHQPTLLVVIDGRDEAVDVRWTAYVAPLFTTDFRGLFRVIFTSREEAWGEGVTLKDSAAFTVRTVKTPNFTPQERDTYLRSRNVGLQTCPKR